VREISQLLYLLQSGRGTKCETGRERKSMEYALFTVPE